MVDLELKIDSAFLEEEVRCGFKVTRKRKEIWAIELDLLHQFDSFCRKNGLKYCVGAGTMLGAVRHKGFIPWDDDIDVYMLREDYDRMTKISEGFRYPYFLQNSYTEKNLLRSYARLRNMTTTGCTEMDRYRLIEKGIFIDIFPLDGISDTAIDQKQIDLNRKYLQLFACYNVKKTKGLPKSAVQRMKLPLKKAIAFLCIKDKMELFEQYERNVKKYSTAGTKIWGNRSLNFNCPRTRRPIQDYQELVYMPFEMLQVPVPINYDSMLKQQYGNYMEIPEKKDENMHGGLIVSTDYAFDDPRRLQEE